MVVKSIWWILYCLIVVGIYYRCKSENFQKAVLLLADIFLVIMSSGLASFMLILAITLAIYMAARKIEKNESKCKWLLLILGFVVTLGLLLYFKYLSPMIEVSWLVVPIGLSYWALSLWGYLYDVYKGVMPAEKNYLDLLCFTIFFPAIFEGPINLYKSFMPQIKSFHPFDWDKFVSGFQRMIWGYIKTMVIADRIGIFVNGALAIEETRGLILLLVMMLYMFQLYADFSGGIDIIMGLAEILGFKLAENFNSPLVSKSVTEYWKRWHKTLGDWMQKYVYYPIVLNRRLQKMTSFIKNEDMQLAIIPAVASFVTFVVVGIWHGTGWNYLIWGCYQATFVTLGILLSGFYQRLRTFFKINARSRYWHIITAIRTFIIEVLGLFIIKTSSLQKVAGYYQKLFKLDNFGDFTNGTLLGYGLSFKNCIVMLIGVAILIFVDIMHFKKFSFRKYLMKYNILVRYSVYIILILVVLIFGIYGPGYDAAAFIYQAY